MFIGQLAEKGGGGAWDVPVVRVEVLKHLQNAGVTIFDVHKGSKVVRFLFPEAGGSVNTYSDEVKVALSGRPSLEEIDSDLAASIGMTVKQARDVYKLLFNPELDKMPFSGEQDTILVGAKIVGNVTYAELADGEHFKNSKSGKAIEGYTKSKIFTDIFNSLSDDEKVSAAQKFKPEAEESDVRAKLRQPIPVRHCDHFLLIRLDLTLQCDYFRE
jgi:hypothetical protein